MKDKISVTACTTCLRSVRVPWDGKDLKVFNKKANKMLKEAGCTHHGNKR